MMLILSVCLWPECFLVNKVSRWMGGVSFSLYLWHPLIIIHLFGLYAIVGELLGTGVWNFLACALLTLSIISAFSYFSFRYIEMPGMKYGKRLSNEY